MGVNSLGYVSLNVSDMTGWKKLLEKVFGLEPRQREGSKKLDYRLDNYHHRFTLNPAEEDGVEAVGWEVESMVALENLVKTLKDRQIEVVKGSASDCANRLIIVVASIIHG